MFLAALLVGGCARPDDGILRFASAAQVVSLDPRFATDAVSTRVNRLIYQRLVDFDDHFRPIPSLAAWQRVDARHYRLELAAGRPTFSDGRALTARDVQATYASILDPATASPHRSSLAVIERIEVPDPDTVDFYLEHADPLFPGRLVVGILPAELAASAEPIGHHPLGSGAFELLDWDAADRLRLRRRADGQVIEILRVSDPTVRLLKLIRGEIDMFQGDTPPELLAWMEERDDVRVQRDHGNNFTYLGFNLEDPLTGRLAFREAVASAIDREAIIHYVLKRGARAANALLTPDHWAGNPDIAPLVHDPQRAAELLAGLGYTSERRPALEYKTSSDPFRIRLATVIQDQLRRAGIDVAISSYDWGTFYGDIKAGRFQMFSLSWVGVKMPDIFRYVFASDSVPPTGANRGRYRNPEVDRLIDAAERSDTLPQQAEYYRQIQAILRRDLPYVPLWYEDQVFVSRAGIAGYQVSPDGNYDGLAHVTRAAAAVL